MPRFVVLLLLLLSCVCAPSWAETGQQRAEAAGRGLVGSPAPRLVLKTIDGKVIDLAGLYGRKAVYLKFWATWCVPCREQMPHLERTFERAGPDLAVVAIDVGFDDSVDAVRRYRREAGLKMPIVFDADGTLGAAFNLRVTPQHVVIGRDGRIAYVGHMADARVDAALLAARKAPVRPMVAGAKAPTPPSPVAVGDRLPVLELPTLDGATFRVTDAVDRRPTVLVFLSPWCESYLADSRPALAARCREVREQRRGQAGIEPFDGFGLQRLRIEFGARGQAVGQRCVVLDERQREAVPAPHHCIVQKCIRRLALGQGQFQRGQARDVGVGRGDRKRQPG